MFAQTVAPLSRLRALWESPRRVVEERKTRIAEFGKLCYTSGYVPEIRHWLTVIGRPLARLWMFIQVGRVKVIGKKNRDLKGRVIFVPNHSSLLDAPLMFSILPRRKLHFMAAHDVMNGLNGKQAIVMGAVGCYPVDRSRGYTVVRPSIDLVVGGNSLVIFPEAKMYFRGECVPLKRGAAFIAKHAFRRSADGGDVAIVPVEIKYLKRDQGSYDKGYFAYGLKWRAGATVTFGEPMYMSEMESVSDREITACIHDYFCDPTAARKVA